MGSSTSTTDYEGVFPPKRHRTAPTETDIQVWPGLLKDDSESSSAVRGYSNSSASKGTPRGHVLTFAGLFVFSVILYFRPYELIPGLSSFTSMAFYAGIVTLAVYLVTQVALEGNLSARPREVDLVLLFAVAAVISIPTATNPNEAWETLTETLLKAVLIFIVIVNVVRSERRLKLMILLAFAVSLYLSLYALYDYQHEIFRIGVLEGKGRIGGSIKGLFANSNDLALHLVTMVPIAFAFGLEKKNIIRKVAYFSIAGLFIAAIIVTFSRGGFLGLTAAVLILAWKLSRQNRVLTIATLSLGLVLFLALAPGDYSGRLSTIFNTQSDLTGSSSQRTEVLKRSVLVSLRYPLSGVGIGNFHHRSPRELESHNGYTQVSSELGIGAMLVYMIFMLYPIRKLRRIEEECFEQPSRRRFYYLSVGLQASIVGYMVSSFFGSVAYQWYVYYLIGYAVALRFVYKNELSYGNQLPVSSEKAS